MTERRSDYRKQIKHKKNSNLLHTIKSAFDGDDDEVDVNPNFKRNPDEIINNVQSTSKANQESRKTANKTTSRNDKSKAEQSTTVDKALKLKKKLNRAILIVIVLIVLVLLALFHL